MSKLDYLLFLGCVIPYRLSSYEISARKVLERLDVKVTDMTDYNCCGFPIAPVDYDLATTLAARNLCLAEKKGLDILTLCNGCFGMLYDINKMLKKDKKARTKINENIKKIGMEFKGSIKVKHLIHVLTEDVGFENIKKTIKKPLNNFVVAQHTGCHLLRPQKIIEYTNNSENPKMLKNLIKLTGSTCVDYLDETQCCGNTIIGVNEKIPFRLVDEKLENIKKSGAQALITVCPSCHLMFDLNQPRIEREFNKKFDIPVFHYTQLLGLAMGFSPEELKINSLRKKPTNLLNLI